MRYFKHIYMTDKSKFRQCSVCHDCNIALAQAYKLGDESGKIASFNLKSAHLEHVRDMRRILRIWVSLGHRDPRFMFLCGDSADSYKFMIPSRKQRCFFCAAVNTLLCKVLSYQGSQKRSKHATVASFSFGHHCVPQ